MVAEYKNRSVHSKSDINNISFMGLLSQRVSKSFTNLTDNVHALTLLVSSAHPASVLLPASPTLYVLYHLLSLSTGGGDGRVPRYLGLCIPSNRMAELCIPCISMCTYRSVCFKMPKRIEADTLKLVIKKHKTLEAITFR